MSDTSTPNAMLADKLEALIPGGRKAKAVLRAAATALRAPTIAADDAEAVFPCVWCGKIQRFCSEGCPGKKASPTIADDDARIKAATYAALAVDVGPGAPDPCCSIKDYPHPIAATCYLDYDQMEKVVRAVLANIGRLA